MTHVIKEFHRVRPKRFPRLWYIQRKPCTYLRQDLHYLQTDQNGLPLEHHHLGVLLGVSKTISEPMLRSTQTVHQPSVKISTISKWIETSFHSSIIT
jgi:hypothetical protein